MNKSLALRIVLIYLQILLPMISFSQKQDTIRQLPEVNVQANRFFDESNTSIRQTRVDSTALSQKVNASFAELLGENTTVYIHSHGRGALATASFRGTSSSHTQVLWNGIPVNSPMLGSTDFSLIPVFLADEVVLDHGTSSLASGSGGLGGSISIRNVPKWNIPFSAALLQSAGSFSTYNTLIDIGGSTSKFSTRTRLYQSQSKNDYTYINRLKTDLVNGELIHPVDTNSNGAFGSQGFLQEISYRPADNQLVSFTSWSQWSSRGIPQATSYEGPGIPNQNESIENGHRYLVSWSMASANNHIQIKSGFSNRKMDYIRRSQVAGLGINPDVYSLTSMQGFHNQLQYTQQFFNNLSAELNLEWNRYDIETRDTIIRTGYQHIRNEFLLSLKTNYQILPTLRLTSILRIDRNELQQTPILPFLGFSWQVIKDKHIELKGNIARNYKLPSLNDLFWQPGGNPDLKPEKGISGELGVKNRIEGENLTLDWELTGYRSVIDDWILWIPSFKGYWEPFNLQKVISQGVEAAIGSHFRWAGVSYSMRGNYALTQTRNFGRQTPGSSETYGKQLVFIPLHSGNILFSAQYNDYFITWQHNSFSERFTTTSNEPGNRNRLYPYFMNDLSAGKSFIFNNLNISARFTIHNLFDETYRTVLMHPMPGRNYLLTLRIQYQTTKNPNHD